MRHSALGTAGIGLGLGGAWAAGGIGKQRFFRADELTEEQRARMQEAKALKLHQEGVRELSGTGPSTDSPEDKSPIPGTRAKPKEPDKGKKKERKGKGKKKKQRNRKK